MGAHVLEEYPQDSDEIVDRAFHGSISRFCLQLSIHKQAVASGV